jgi:hypothetical protein
LDLKYILRDLLLQGHKKAQTTDRNYFALNRIAKILVSKEEAIRTYMTHEILLKILKPIVQSNTILRKSCTGKRVGFIVNNDQLRASLISNSNAKDFYKDQLKDCHLVAY